MKYLNNIKSPSDLKSYSSEELEFICDELREYIISTINEIGGHLAPTLGTIELTTALHYVYNTPEDKLIWDTGHQAYAHKVLTGRFDSLKTIRKYKGLSGFLKRTESEYDVFGAGHASTSISAGLGIACARDLDDQKFKVVSIIGDGALTGGLAFEALNNAGHLKKQLLVIVNDNDMSISPNVGAFRNYLVKIATNKSYNYVRSKIGRLISRLPKHLKFIEALLKKVESSAKNFFLPTTIFEDLGFRYFGPIDGHNINELVSTLKNIKELDTPVVLHTITKKGKGLDYAEHDPVKYHGVKEKKDTPIKKTSEVPIFQNVFAEVSCNLANENKNIVAITAAMREGTGLVNFAKEFPDRYFDVGIAEAHGVTFAGGLAVNGKIPIVAIYSTFLQRGYDQIIHDIALQKLPVIFCLDRSGLVGEDGATHHGVLDIAYMKCIQGMVVTAPKDGNELQDLMFTATNHTEGPFSIRYPKESSINFDNTNSNIIKIGSWEVVNKGEDILILAVGSMVKRSMDIVENLKERDIKSEVVNCRFIKPMDLEYLENNCSKFSKIVTIEEGVLDGGFGESVTAWISNKKLKNDILNIGLPNDFVDHGPRNILLEEVGLDSKALYEKIVKFVDR
jgi:1-deoxy-D-xylulose-5-phosphate synthase